MADPSAIIPREHSAAFRLPAVIIGSGWLFSLGLVAVVAAAVTAGGLFFYRRALLATQANWFEQITAQETELRPELLVQLTELSSALAVSRELVANHPSASNALLLIQSVTHPFVYFTSLTFSRDGRKIELSGAARSYQVVAEQIRSIESHPQVEQVEFGGLSRGERGLVNFKVTAIFKPALLRF